MHVDCNLQSIFHLSLQLGKIPLKIVFGTGSSLVRAAFKPEPLSTNSQLISLFFLISLFQQLII